MRARFAENACSYVFTAFIHVHAVEARGIARATIGPVEPVVDRRAARAGPRGPAVSYWKAS